MTSSDQGEDILIGLFSGKAIRMSLLLEYIKESPSDEFIPTISDTLEKEIEYQGKKLKVHLATDDGQEELSHIRSQLIQDVKGFYFIIDVTDAKSINEANEIYNRALETHSEGIICVVAAGNTEVDKDQWQVNEDEINKLANKLKAKTFLVSYKTRQNLDESFLYLIEKIIEAPKNPNNSKGSQQKSSNDSESCCTIF